MSPNNTQKEQHSTPAPRDIEDFNQQLIEAYEAELLRLREADSKERSVIYDKAAKMGIKIIRGEV